MEYTFNPENNKNFKKIIFLIGGVVAIALLLTLFLLKQRNGVDLIRAEKPIPSSLVVLPAQEEKKTLFSPEILSWANYFWPRKLNLKYPSNWQLIEIEYKNEEQKELEVLTGRVIKGEIVGLKLIPPTSDSNDQIMIGGRLISCAQVLKYLKNKCLKNKMEVPFYTNSSNKEVLTAFDLIFQNAILIEDEK